MVQKILAGSCLLLALLQAGLMAYYAWYNFPTIDDYWYALKVQQFGVAGAVVDWYMTINGRLGSNLIMGLVSQSYPKHIFPFQWQPIVLLLAVWLTGRMLVQRFFSITNHWQLGLGSTCFTGAWLLMLPDYYESLFWASASVNYQWPWLFAVWGWLCYDKQQVSSWSKIVGSGLWLLAACCNEVVALTLLGTAVVLYFSAMQAKRQPAAAMLLVSALALMAEVLAPGNQAKLRQASQQLSELSLSAAIVAAYAQVGRYVLLHVLANPFIWLALISLGKRPPQAPGLSSKERLQAALLLWPLLAVPLLLAWLQQDYFPLRISGFLLSGLLLWICWMLATVRFRISDRLLSVLLFLSLVLMPIAHRNWYIGWQQAFAETPAQYHHAAMQRLDRLRSTGTDSLSLPIISPKPFFLAPVLPEDNADVQGYLQAIHGKTIQFVP